MIKRFITLLTILSIPGLCFGQTSSAQRGTCWGNNESSSTPATTTTLSISPTGGTGHLLVGFCRAGNGASVTITLSDPTNGSWTMIGSTIINSDSSDMGRMGYFPDAAAGTYTLTCTFSTSRGYRALAVCEYSDMASASVLDTNASGSVSESSPATSVTTGSFTTTNANDVLVLMATYSCTSCTRSNGTIAGTSVAPGTLGNDAMVYDRDVSATQTTQTATAAATSSNGWIAAFGAFKRASGGGGATVHKLPALGAGLSILLGLSLAGMWTFGAKNNARILAVCLNDSHRSVAWDVYIPEAEPVCVRSVRTGVEETTSALPETQSS